MLDRKNLLRSPAYRRVGLLISLLPILIVIACWIDGTLRMQGPGKGLLQHYGFWTIFVATPIVLLLTLRLLETFQNSIRDIDSYCIDLTEEMRSRVDRLVKRHTRSLSLHSRSQWILVFVMFVMFLWWLFNVTTTISPFPTYHHDVFDAYGHPFGFYTAKAYIVLVYTLVYAVAIFVALHVTASMVSILRFLYRQDILRINLFHPDNCGGTSVFGNINLVILIIYANFFAIIFAMYITHRERYLAITLALTGCSLLAIAQSVAAVYHIHKTVSKKKESASRR